MKSFDVIVLGGGAAGLMCAAVAGNRGRSVLVLESSNKIGKKILMSGGGRCNFTNLNTTPAHFISANPHFCISALSRYTPFDFLTLVDSYGIAYHEKTAGQLFCDKSSRDILAMLVSECDNAGVEILTHCEIGSIDSASHYAVRSNKGQYESESLVIATGGLSIPKMGASDFGYRLARQFGLTVLDTRAGLVPFTFSGALKELSSRLAGISTSAVLEAEGTSITEDILFTHRGLSGPAALRLSNYWSPGQPIKLDLLPQQDLQAALLMLKASQPRTLLRTFFSTLLPRALVNELQALIWQEAADTPIGELGNDRLRRIAADLKGWTLKPSGTEGYRTAEVTLGGVDTDELSSQTMESKQQPGLYCIGEVVDVTGDLGGFNFQWAWASARAAGQVA